LKPFYEAPGGPGPGRRGILCSVTHREKIRLTGACGIITKGHAPNNQFAV
jgi:hypothetical protein